MANLFVQRERRVIPNWRSFISTSKLKELGPSRLTPPIKKNLSIYNYLEAWDRTKSIAIAGDLISAGFVNGFINNNGVKDAARYILKNKRNSTDSQKKLACIILGISDNLSIRNIPEVLEKYSSIENIYTEIHKIRGDINYHPYNPIQYVELSRIYAILGLEDKSIKNMKIAICLAPENRFVLRAAVRLFVHYDKISYIHNLIKKSEIVKFDPWITSSEIALATIKGKRSINIKSGIQMIESGQYSWHSLTELASSIGTIEYLDGSMKKAKKIFMEAMQSPNDNTLAQIEWINSIDPFLKTDPHSSKVDNKYEALAINEYYSGSFGSALEQCKKWFIDLPFSKHPLIFGAHIAGSLLDNIKESIELLKKGLTSHPKDSQILNNLAYSYALENNINESEKYIRLVNNISDIKPETKICLTATRGLLSFRKGLFDEGNILYRKAIDDAKYCRNAYLNWLASLNYARELALSSKTNMSLVENLINRIPENVAFPNLIKLKNDIIIVLKSYSERM